MVLVYPCAVIICDDHPLIRAGMAASLAAEPTIAVVEQLADPRTVAAVLADHPAAVLVTRDRFLDGGPLSELDPQHAGVVASLDLDPDEGLFVPAGRGVRALIHRAGPPEDVRRAVLAVGRGAGFIAPELVRPLLDTVRRGGAAPAGPVDDLTQRENEVLRLVVRGAANREIAATLQITEKTVKFHVSNLLAKSGLRSRTQLIAAMSTLDLVPGHPWSSARRQRSR